MSSSNDDISAFLKYYCAFPRPPQFAVLITGPWGCGKSHLIKEFFVSARPSDAKSDMPRDLYVSLYGIGNVQQIGDALFEQLHPILSSKGMKVLGAIVRGFIKTTIKIDLDAAGKNQETISSQIPDINLPEYLTNVKDRVLVFDDLERCSMSPRDVLGYINSFVEHDDCKVIIIANEEEILKGEFADSYKVMKEKLIGKTFEVIVEFDEAFDHFISAISRSAIKKFFRQNRTEIRALFDRSKTSNLRILQQTMWDYERLATSLDKRHLNNAKGMKALYELFFALSFEIRSARLGANELSVFKDSYWARALRSHDSKIPKTKFEEVSERYPDVDWHDPVLPWPLFSDILTRSVIDRTAILAALDQHRFFAGAEKEPSWSVLWHSFERSDDEVATAITRLESEFINRQFVFAGEILQVVGIRLWLARIGAIRKTVDVVKQESIEYIDDLCTKNRFTNVEDDMSFRAWRGLGFQEAQTEEFKEVFEHLRAKQAQVLEDSYPEKAKRLLSEMKSDVGLFFRRLCPTNNADNIYASIPILQFLKPEEFVDQLLSIPRGQQLTVFTMFKARYDFIQVIPQLKLELPWLREVDEILKERVSAMPPVARYALTMWAKDTIKSVLEKNPP